MMLEIPDEVQPPFDCAIGCMQKSGAQMVFGDETKVFDYMSVTKVFAAIGVLVAVERGHLELGTPVEVAGETVTIKHLLAHASGVAFDKNERQAEPETRRIYSNFGFERMANAVEEHVGTAFNDWLETEVLEPLGMVETSITGSCAYSGTGSLRDLMALANELLEPTLISTDLHDQMLTETYPGIRGITPGYGSYRDNAWGLGVEIKKDKQRTWFPPQASENAFGHFGQSGSFIWVDPARGAAGAFLGDEPFGKWHQQHWQQLGDYLLQCAN
ncbi:serine hydrolase domain-containing protein [Gleimia hominis]|uniref:serine hydrolase domain-containing protein n=1 Tax=Gleimia hominis TaxID=595468 RepID=UPI000C80E92B|nr:serine hydrolase domain-containing protein [Gleimia hominis]WIK64466.1 serine hydrolase domain-containing protein [Gleimia hominis]